MSPSEPAAKKQKSSAEAEEEGATQSHEANLEISVGGDGEEGGNKAVVRFYNSAVLANKSKYIDAMLASPMIESKTYKISFSNTPIEIFDLALKFVLNAVEARKMTVKDVVKVAKFYDQYDFVDGRALCDHVLSEYFDSLPQQEEDSLLDVDLVVGVVVVSHVANLTESYQKASDYIKRKMKARSVPFNKTMFTERHVATLAPVIVDLVDVDNSFLKWMTGQKLDKQQIENPLFPCLFTTASFKDSAAQDLLRDAKIHVSGSGIEGLDGEYNRIPRSVGFDKSCSVTIDGTLYETFRAARFVSYGWQVRAKQQGNQSSIVLWQAKYSSTTALPPKNNWKPVHPIAEGGSLKIGYSCGVVRPEG